MAGDIFGSTSTAALAWTLTFWGESDTLGVEFASNIYVHSDGGFFFGTPIKGTARSVGIPTITEGNTRAAIIHSHPTQGFFANILYNIPPGQLNWISPCDRIVSWSTGVPVYVAGPTQVRRYMRRQTGNPRGYIVHRSGGLWR